MNDESWGSDEAPHSRSRGWRIARWALLVGFAAIVVWGGLVAQSAMAAVRDAERGQEALRELRRLPLDDLVDPQVATRLRAAEASFASAARRLDGARFTPVQWLPVLGRNLATTRRLAVEGAELTGAAAQSVTDADELVERADGGGDRLVLLAGVKGVLGRTEAAFGDVDLGPAEGLLGPVADARAEAAEAIEDLRARLESASVMTDGVVRLLTGPRSVLVLAANNAEMRAGTGMLLSAGVAEVQGGQLDLGPFGPSYRNNPTPGAVPPDGVLADPWGVLAPTDDFRNVALTPDFPTVAEHARRMWAAGPTGGGVTPDVVLAIDPVAMAAVLEATGPIDVERPDGTPQRIAAEGVVDFLLNGQYAGIGGGGDAVATVERREVLGAVARGIVGRMTDPGSDLRALVRRLAAVAPGRHVLAWSAEPVEQAAFSAMGVDGALPADAVTISLLNRGQNKLDPFVSVDARLQVAPGADGAEVTVPIQLDNRTPASGQPGYVTGPSPTLTDPIAAGEYLGLLAVHVPAAATDVAIEIAGVPVADPVVDAPDATTRVIGAFVRVPRGTALVARVRFRLSAEVRALTVAPSARIPAVGWIVEGATVDGGGGGRDTFRDEGPRTVSW